MANTKRGVRGSRTGRPIMVLLDLVGQRWTLRILWELRSGAQTFRALQQRCEEISPTLLNGRLRQLREFGVVAHDGDGYVLSQAGRELQPHLLGLNAWAEKWVR
jgi:DNA-binding HxlR family transcriptional regulator